MMMEFDLYQIILYLHHKLVSTKISLYSGDTKGQISQIEPKITLARRRFSQKQTDDLDLFAVKSKKANKTDSSVLFLGESMARKSAFKIN